MASNADAHASNLETPITIKAVFEGSNRKFKLPLQDLSVAVFAEKIRSILQIPEGQPFVLERFSDSGNAYITLDQNNPSAYKQLYRAAKAKLKLRIRATLLYTDKPTVAQDSHKRELPSMASTYPPLVPKLSYPCSMPSSSRPVEPKAAIGARDFSCVQARDQFFQQLASISREREMGRRMKEAPAQVPSSFWQIFCNNCDKPMADAHFHCSICDGGDYDLCETCVETGKICPGEGHWLIKRFIKSGKVVTSATETLPPKPRESADHQHEIPGAFKTDVKLEQPISEPSRTCNSCVKVLPESALVTCNECPDYDLCVPCLKTEQGHHPGHSFGPTVAAGTVAQDVAALCAPGRNIHHHAICDGCDEPIHGVRHKCMTCPDWDFCGKCFQSMRTAHAGHRFVPVYDNLEVAPAPRSVHYGILCDGPLCLNKPGKAYVRGVRYKCAVCHDTDFCANCEAHPSNKHNETHPMIKFKTPVRGAHVTLVDEAPGLPRHIAGDVAVPTPRAVGRPESVRSTATLPPYTAATEMKTEKTSGAKDVASQTKPEEKVGADKQNVSSAELDAHFVRDRVADGTRLASGTDYLQTWTLKNPGPHAWPVGTAVHFVGGDCMSPLDVATFAATYKTIQGTNPTTKPIQPGQEYDFDVRMRAPVRVGKHISYWRLKAPDGLPFGHRLWCDIETITPERKTRSGTLADFQAQLQFLEQQNMKRLMMAKQELASSLDSVTNSNIVHSSAAPESEAADLPTVNETAAVKNVMVFPTLEKESPSSSTLQERTPIAASTPTVPKSEGPKSDAGTETEAETVTSTTSVPEAEERFEDLESVEYDDSDTENDGFLTDEEYDILDASDEEMSNRGRTTM